VKIEAKYLKRMRELLEPPTVNFVPSFTTSFSLAKEISRFLHDYFRGDYDEEITLERNLSIYVSIDGLALFLRQNFNAVMGRQMIDIRMKTVSTHLYLALFYDTSCITEEALADMKKTAELCGIDFEVMGDSVTVRIKGTVHFSYSAVNSNFVYQRLVNIFSPGGKFTPISGDE